MKNAPGPTRRRRILRGWRGFILLTWWATGSDLAWADNTVGLLLSTPRAFEGYTLFAPGGSRHTYLINNAGELIRRWTSAYRPGHAAYLLENGHLLRAARLGAGSFNGGGAGGRVEEYDWEGRLVWGFNYSTTQYRQHHDAIRLPNGNVLMIAWEAKTFTQAIAAGRNPSLLTQNILWPDTLVEVAPGGTTEGTIVWAWRAWDHLIQDYDDSKSNFGVVAEHPERIDLNFPGDGTADWLHVNGIDYHPDFDQILISVHDFGEIWIIDHSTTLSEAAGSSGGRSGRGGDLLYRWGNPRAYRAGTTADQKLFGQHNPTWIRNDSPGAGNILIFNNGVGRPGGAYSSVEEMVPPADETGRYALSGGPGSAYGPAAATWTYTAAPPTSFYAMNISGAQRLPNGNTLICHGPRGSFFEVSPEGETVWHYLNPVGNNGPIDQGIAPGAFTAFRAPRYPPDYAGLANRDLTPWGTVELDPNAEFEIIQAVKTASGLSLRWNSRPDTVYTVEYRGATEDESWAQIATITALGTEAFFVDANPERLTKNQGFYRVSVPSVLP